MNYTFKIHGAKYTPERLNGKQIAAGLLYFFFGISTRTYRTTRTKHANDWKRHADGIQAELDEQRKRGWSFRYIDGKRVDYTYIIID